MLARRALLPLAVLLAATMLASLTGCATTDDGPSVDRPRLTIRIAGVARAADGRPRLDDAVDAAPVLVTEEDVIGTIRSRRNDGGPMLVLRLDADAAARVATATRDVGRDMSRPLTAIVTWDGTVLAAPRVMGPLSDRLGVWADDETLEAIARHLASLD